MPITLKAHRSLEEEQKCWRRSSAAAFMLRRHCCVLLRLRWGMSRAELEKRILRLHRGGTGILKIGKTLGIGTGTVQRVVMEQPRPFDVGVAEAAFASQ
jgi:hypothetical protein